ncbi:methyltransferase [Amycolatopsis rubida]|uniref:Methyltransferase n=1 Tax=Amycolatopsis rubida TaxID=112413 RepID=A0ABX0CA75_9PSEU|nr:MULTISPECIES: methyltransferase [Amycolatopsis]MYW97342.1 methyltransferase [Amycolatopsis rubida]NEC62327.1 methyltransferase [Amycolatopsis rubida]OAP22829.1 Carminomycin 4-O-methyltransferase [Amycolatopsis sp. M39]
MSTTEHSAAGSEEAPAVNFPALTDVVTPFAVRCAATLRLADLIGAGSRDAAALAESAGADPAALARLLDHLCVAGLFAADGDSYRVTAAGAVLREDHPAGLRATLDLETFVGRSDSSCANLLHSVRTGEPGYQKTFGAPLWTDTVAHPELVTGFEHLHEMFGAWSEPTVTGGFDWASAKQVVDVGCGHGAVLRRLLLAFGHLRATLVDLPEIVARAEQSLGEAGLGDRVSGAPGSYFDPLPEGADTYLLSLIVHQEPHERAVALLRRCADAAGSHGTVLVMQAPVTPANRFAMTALDLRMLVTVGGRERTVDQYRDLFAEAGLRIAGQYAGGSESPVDPVLFACVAN